MKVNDEEKPRDLLYSAEYAKSGRALCKGCKDPISKNSLRMAIRFQSNFFDGMQENWHHFDCFWKKARKNDINELSIKGMEWLKWEDQELIRQRIIDLQSMPDNYNTQKSSVPKVDRAKTSAGKCYKCKEKIEKAEVRISFKASYYHIKCIKELNIISASSDCISGYELLDSKEKFLLDEFFPKIIEENLKRKADVSENDIDKQNLSKKSKIDESVIGDDIKNRKKLKAQSEILWSVRKAFNENLNKDEIENILLSIGYNKHKHDSLDKRLEILTDCAVFGIPKKCTECMNGMLRFSSTSHTYRCDGAISEFTRCNYEDKKPQRLPFKIPKALIKKYPFLDEYKKPKLSKRVYAIIPETEKLVLESTAAKGFNIFAKAKPIEEIQKTCVVVKNGCTVDSNCEVAENTHVYINVVTSIVIFKNKIKKIIDEAWQASLSATDVQAGRNSYYKLQLLKHDDKNKYYLFRSWGRIGTTSGGTKTESFGADLDKAKEKFKELFLEKTRNNWEDRHNFKKHMFGMNLLEIDLLTDEGDVKNKLDLAVSNSTLPTPIKKLISLIFDVDAMQTSLKQLEEMPLGKLSKKHILNAYSVLTQVQEILKDDSLNENQAKLSFVDASNRFYSLIPHNSGLKSPRLLNNLDIIMEKTKMLDNLLEIQLSYSLINSEKKVNDDKIDIYDQHYNTLNCKMEVLDHDSKEFKLINKYAKNTHAPTHDSYTLEILDIIKIKRESDVEQFKADIGNRYLLWHGSRISNYVGIISQGLRIAPPEAPVSGYMFGKGIYMADMISKSANYCNVRNGIGLLVLCDAALGNIQELYNSKYIKKLKDGINSIKGVGGTIPDPKKTIEIENNLKVPYGKTIKNYSPKCKLLYNEYVVYDESQVQMKYLVQVKFNSK